MVTEAQVLEALSEVTDPELGVNIVDLGLVYGVAIANGRVSVVLTMTSRACPLHAHVTEAAAAAVRRACPAAEAVDVDLVWEPPWDPVMMSDRAKAQLGWQT